MCYESTFAPNILSYVGNIECLKSASVCFCTFKSQLRLLPPIEDENLSANHKSESFLCGPLCCVLYWILFFFFSFLVFRPVPGGEVQFHNCGRSGDGRRACSLPHFSLHFCDRHRPQNLAVGLHRQSVSLTNNSCCRACSAASITA